MSPVVHDAELPAPRSARAAWTREAWLSAWGKFPMNAPVSGSTSSAKRPRGPAMATSSSKTLRASDTSPVKASA